MDAYQMLFKRKSFHLFGKTEVLSKAELDALETFLKNLVPLEPGIRTGYRLVRERDKNACRGAEYRIELFSEEKENDLFNIGYIGEQIDLWCAAYDIGALWYGIGKPEVKELDGMRFVIMILIAKMPPDKFRKDVFKAKRKSLEEIWQGETLGIAEIARFAPSACNTQPWFTENDGKTLTVYRVEKAGKRGIMPKALVGFYNRIDTGIFLYVLELCLQHEGFPVRREAVSETPAEDPERTRITAYLL